MTEDVGIDEPTLSATEQGALRAIVGLMIPANDQYQVPAASDDAIFADIVLSLGRETATVRAALRELDQYSGGVFAEQDVAQQHGALLQLRDAQAPLATALVNATVRCYYRDDRVMRALGMEARAPFPKGFDLAEGDWSLLEPVRARGRIYRDV